MMSDTEVLSNAKSALKSVVVNLECSLGVETALPITLRVLEAIDAVAAQQRAPE